MTRTDKDYHEKFESWALDVARELRDALKDEGIGKRSSEKIVGSFLFRLSMQFDHGGFYKVNGEFKPKMAFQDLLGELIIPVERTYLHETAHSIAGIAFDEVSD